MSRPLADIDSLCGLETWQVGEDSRWHKDEPARVDQVAQAVC
jgi:hypothetical protein